MIRLLYGDSSTIYARIRLLIPSTLLFALILIAHMTSGILHWRGLAGLLPRVMLYEMGVFHRFRIESIRISQTYIPQPLLVYHVSS